jgi:hypothetical protein
MNTELRPFGALMMTTLLLVGAAGAAEQMITPIPLQQAVGADQALAFTVGYSTANPCSDQLTGLGLRVHWDSSRLAFVGLSGMFPTDLVAQGSVENDATDADGDPPTDKFVQVAWADIDGAWPGGGCGVTNLYTANFRTLPGFSDATAIRFSASSTAAGHVLSPSAAQVTPLVPSTDGDQDGIPDATETAWGLDPQNGADAAQDADGDGVSNLGEYQAGTDPLEHPYGRQLQQMYVAYYGRPGDPGGVNYWAGRMALVGGNWIPDLVNAFGASAEYTERFGVLSAAALIDNLYRQLFNRGAEPVGLSFYVDLLNGTNQSGYNPTQRQSTLAQIALDIANGTAGGDVLTLDNKLDTATAFTRELLITRHPYAGPDIPLVVRLISTVTDDRQSVDIAAGYTDAFMAGIPDGLARLDEDAFPGTYANLHGGDCSWARLLGLSGLPSDVLVSGSQEEPGAALVTLAPTDAGFQSSHCGTWISDDMPLVAAPEAPHTSGIYRVGRDMRIGTWRADNPAGGCSWERLDGFGGSAAEVIASGFATLPGPVDVTIEDTDTGFAAAGCGIWTLQPGN